MMRPHWAHLTSGLTLLAILAAGCGSDDDAPAAATATATVTLPTATPSPPTTPTPTMPVLGETECEQDDDGCSATHSRLFAIAHSYTDPQSTILYRITVPPWSTGTNWGDGTNGFFYQAIVGGHAPQTLTYVPFNGVGVGSDGKPALPQFFFIVPVDVSAGTQATSLTIQACASNFAGTPGSAPACTTVLWSDAYSALPVPSVGQPPFADVFLQFQISQAVSVPNTGVYPGVLTLEPSGITTEEQAEWLADHLVFWDECLQPYTNDLFDDTSHRSAGVLTIDEAMYPNQDGSAYVGKYGDGSSLTPASFPNAQYFFYTLDQQSTAQIGVGVDFIYDLSADCPGYINSVGSSAASCGGAEVAPPAADCSDLPNVALTAELSPLQPGQDDQSPPSLSTNVEAGTQQSRTLFFQEGGGICAHPLNPLAGPNGRPNYVIRQDSASGGNFWAKPFADALYYVVPSGFGNCDLQHAVPFCELTSNYAAYIPQYAATDGSYGTLNGGSTEAPQVGSLSLADEYALQGLTGSQSNALVWFDNCGYGYVYEECTGCTQRLGTRKTLPIPPTPAVILAYQIANDLPGAVAFSKECCASWYQENQSVQPTAYEPPHQLDNGNGAFIGAGQSLHYQTMFSDEATVVYDATTGERLFKLRLTEPSNMAVYACSSSDAWSAGGSGSSPSYDITLAAAGAQSHGCGQVGDCPFGTASNVDGSTVTCTATLSSYLLGIPEWSTEIALVTDAVRVQAWGADGKGGTAPPAFGVGGFALTTVDPADLFDLKGLYAYIGASEEGASTVVTATELSKLTSEVASGIQVPADAGVFVIAGGGGEQGDTYGGAGAVAIANANPPPGSPEHVSVRGYDAQGGDSHGGLGGNMDGCGGTCTGGSPNYANVGIGGCGREGWTSGYSLIPLSCGGSGWSAGNGGKGSEGGDGGGGFGGGGAGESQNENGDSTGGGGGGSWAASNTAYDPTAPTSAPGSPNGATGAVQLVYTKTRNPNLCPQGAISTVNGTAYSCVFTASVALDLAAWVNSLPAGYVDDETVLRVTGWGGGGGTTGSTPGSTHGGRATLLTTVGSLVTSGPVNVYVGAGGCGGRSACGGTSTIALAATELSAIDADATDPSTQGILLIAGGAGGNGQDTFSMGGPGGQCESSTSGPCSAAGGSGTEGSAGGSGGSAGQGGSPGEGGVGAQAGSNGIGGLGGGPSVGRWIPDPSGSIVVPSSWVAGNGAGALNSRYGGGGGGGWGGGGSGADTTDGAQTIYAYGGGGGGSFASQSTVANPYPTPTNGSSKFEIYFEIE